MLIRVAVLINRSIAVALTCVGVCCVSLFAIADDAAQSSTAFVPQKGWTTTSRLVTEYATQAAAADEKCIYAISSTTVAKFARSSSKLLATATDSSTKHLNSGFLDDGKLYCAHSNYPDTPHESDIRIYNPRSNSLTVFHRFIDPPGSLVWCIRKNGHWWCCFAHYGEKNHRTVLIEYAEDGLTVEAQRFLFPKEVIADFDGMSGSGGIWFGDSLLVSHHHFPVLYELKCPGPNDPPDRLILLAVRHCPFPGQGFGIDKARLAGAGWPHLVGIDRRCRAVVLAAPE